MDTTLDADPRACSRSRVPRYKLTPIFDEDRQRYKVEIPASIAPAGRRTRLFFPHHWQALKCCQSVRQQLVNFGLSLKLLNPHDTTDAMAALKLLGDHHAKTGERQSLQALAEEHVRRWHRLHESVSLGTLFDQYLQTNGTRISAKHQQNLRHTRARFAPLLETQVCEIAAANLERTIADRPDFAFNSHIRNLSSVLGYGVRKRYLAENVAAQVDFRHVPRKEISLLTNETIVEMFDHAMEKQPKLIAYLALSIFCGVRTMRELPLLEWRDIDLGERRIVCIRPQISKSRARRFIALSDNAYQFLRYYRAKALCARPAPEERVLAVFAPEGLRKARRRMWQHIGMEQPTGSIFRHVFASNHLAHYNDINRLCVEMGHTSPKITFDRYAMGSRPTPQANSGALAPTR